MNALPQASSVAARVDGLFDAMLVLSAIVTAVVWTVIVWFCIRYRHGTAVDRSMRPDPWIRLEMAWMLVPLVLFLGLFGWSTGLFAVLLQPPSNATPVYVVAKQWMWQVEHPGGQREINTLHVPVGEPVRLVMISQDVIHSFYVPAFRVKQDVLPGRYTQLWFTAIREGTFNLFCAEFCGTDHSRMGGSIVVMDPSDYAHWLGAQGAQGLEAQGAALFRRLGCSGCHDPHSSVHAPDLDGLYQSTVPLASGAQVRADDRYLHDSILLPGKDVAAGYDPIMPSYQGRISEADVLALIAYLKGRAAPGAPR